MRGSWAVRLLGLAPRARGQLVVVPAAATHCGYRNILAIPRIATFLHPDAFATS